MFSKDWKRALLLALKFCFVGLFCDANSEKGFVWTLIESFSRHNKNQLADKPIYKSYPINQDGATFATYDSHSKPLNARASNVLL